MGEVQLQPGVSSHHPPHTPASPLFPFWFGFFSSCRLTLTASGKWVAPRDVWERIHPKEAVLLKANGKTVHHSRQTHLVVLA